MLSHLLFLDHFSTTNFEVYYPVVIFDGVMYVAKLQSGEIELDEVFYVQLAWETQEYEQVIDVVSKQYFDQYLKTLDEELDNLSKIIETLKGIWDRVFDRINEILFGKK
jgi:hypothetical protein